MQLRRARRLSSEGTMYQGAYSVSVAASMMSRAREYSNHLLREHRSVGLSFHCRSGSLMRASKRRLCSASLTSSQNLASTMPTSPTYLSNSGHTLRKRWCSAFEQKPITYSTPARLYQLRSKITTSPAAGKCSMKRCTYSWDFSRSDGAGSATTRKRRGLTRSVIALIVPPLPAASRPSKTTTTRRPFSRIQSWKAHSSMCKVRSSFSYSLRFIGLSAVLIGVVSSSPRVGIWHVRRASPRTAQAKDQFFRLYHEEE